MLAFKEPWFWKLILEFYSFQEAKGLEGTVFRQTSNACEWLPRLAGLRDAKYVFYDVKSKLMTAIIQAPSTCAHAVLWAMEFVRVSLAPRGTYTPVLTRRAELMELRLRQLGQALGERRRPLPDISQLMDEGKAMTAGAWLWLPSGAWLWLPIGACICCRPARRFKPSALPLCCAISEGVLPTTKMCVNPAGEVAYFVSCVVKNAREAAASDVPPQDKARALHDGVLAMFNFSYMPPLRPTIVTSILAPGLGVSG